MVNDSGRTRDTQQTMCRMLKSFYQLFISAVAGVLLILFSGCTGSPTETSYIEPRNRTISGTLSLDGWDTADGIFVWLDGYHLYTYTDENGQFELVLPIGDDVVGMGDAEGVHRLYYFMANYKIEYSTVIIQNGEVLDNRADIGSYGEVLGTVSLRKILDIGIAIQPDEIDENFEGEMLANLTLQAVTDTIIVILPKVVDGESSAVLLKNIHTQDVYVVTMGSHTDFLIFARISIEEYGLNLPFRIDRGFLPSGQYEVVPFFLIIQDGVPVELYQSLGIHVDNYGPDYLKMPFKRELAILEVKEHAD